jgi:hypothetical protein
MRREVRKELTKCEGNAKCYCSWVEAGVKHQVRGRAAREDSYVHNGKVPISGTYDGGSPFEGRKTCVVRSQGKAPLTGCVVMEGR